MAKQIGAHLAYLGSVEAVAFAQVHWAAWAVEQEHGFAFCANDMHMGRRVVFSYDLDGLVCRPLSSGTIASRTARPNGR